MAEPQTPKPRRGTTGRWTGVAIGVIATLAVLALIAAACFLWMGPGMMGAGWLRMFLALVLLVAVVGVIVFVILRLVGRQRVG